MKQLVIMLATLFLSLTGFAVEMKGKHYGKPITLSTITHISKIMATPEEYVGKKVLVKGVVVDVCSHRGCWMDIASDVPFEKIQIKVADGEIVFPLDAKGKPALVEGILEKLQYSREQIIEWKQHHAEMHGESFNPNSITSGETYYRIQGIGAIIEE